MGPILGLFEFDIFGTTAYAYSLVVTFLLFVIARRIVVLALRAVAARDPRQSSAGPRRRHPGQPPARRDLHACRPPMRASPAALLAQTTQFVSLDVLAFHRSADVLLVLVIGGVGYLYGGLIGAVVFKVLQDVLSGLTPQYWQFWIGLILVLLVLAGRERLTEQGEMRCGRASSAASAETPRRAADHLRPGDLTWRPLSKPAAS